jgi:sugar lactone lactonase YvrE
VGGAMQVHSSCCRRLQCHGLKTGMWGSKGSLRSRSNIVLYLSLVLLLKMPASSQTASGPIIFTVAGGGLTAGIPATSTGIGSGDSLASDRTGNLYIADSANYVIHKVDPNGILTTVAGNGRSGLTIDLFGDGLGNPGKIGDGGPAINAEFSFPSNIAEDNNGNLYIDDFEALIRKVDASGVITTVAGTGVSGFSGDGGPATSAQINAFGIAVDGSGNLYISDGGSRIRKITIDGIINTVAGNGTLGFSGDDGPATSAQINAFGIAADSSGNIYITDASSRIRKVNSSGVIATIAGNGMAGFSGDGGPATSAQINVFDSVAVDAAGNLFLPDGFNRVRKVSASGVINTVAGNGTTGSTGDGGPATSAAVNARRVATDNFGNLFIADFNGAGSRVRKVNSAGIISTFAGNGTLGFGGDSKSAISEGLDGPSGLAVDSSGNLYIGDFNDYRIRKVDAAGVITTIAGNGTLGLCAATCPGDGGPATSASMNSPYGIVLDSSGNLYFADASNGRVRKVDIGGVIHTVAGGGTLGLGDGGPATSAQLSEPLAVVLDANGNLYIGDFRDFRVRKVNTAGIINTVAGNGTAGFNGDGGAATSAQLSMPTGLAVDTAGNLYIGDGSRVRKVDSLGTISTFAGNGIPGFSGDGGPATSAELGTVDGLSFDNAGNLYISDGNNRIRKVDTRGVITTFAGSGTLGFSGDGGPAANAQFARNGALVADSSGNVYVGDVFNYRVREITASAFTFAATSPSITISAPGGTGSVGLVLTPAAHFSGTVNLVCSVVFTGPGAPNLPPTCSVTPSPLNLAAPSNSSATLTIRTTAPQAALLIVKRHWRMLAELSASLLFGLVAIVAVPCRARRYCMVFSLSLLTAVLVSSTIGCGGGNGTTSKQTTPGTTAGMYSVTVAATSGGFSNSVVVPVTVQ